MWNGEEVSEMQVSVRDEERMADQQERKLT